MVHTALVNGFMMGWTLNAAYPPNPGVDGMHKVRRDLVLPTACGALRAVAQWVWDTCPPGSTPEMLFKTLSGTLANAMADVTVERQAGAFWLEHGANDHG